MTVFHIEPIPLRKLYLSDRNVRTTPASQEEDEQLEASIDTHGVGSKPAGAADRTRRPTARTAWSPGPALLRR